MKSSTLTAIEKPSFQPRLIASESHNDDRLKHSFYNNDGSSKRGAGIAQRNEAWLEAKADRARKAREVRKREGGGGGGKTLPSKTTNG